MASALAERLVEIVRQGNKQDIISFLSADSSFCEGKYKPFYTALDYSIMRRFQSEKEADEWFGSLPLSMMEFPLLNGALHQNHPLVLAIQYGSIFGVQWLIERGAEIQRKSSRGMSILHYAAERRMKSHAEACEIFDYLICEKNLSADEVDTIDWTPLHHACLLGSFSGVKYLIIHGACIEKRTKTGLTPFLMSCLSGYESFLKAEFLFQLGANVRAVDDGTWCTAMHFAAKREVASEENEATLFDFLAFKCNFNLEEVDSKHDRPVHLACESGSFLAVKWLITHGVMIDAKNVEGFTPFLNACRSHKDSRLKVQYLLDKGANVNDKIKDGSSALHLAATKAFLSEAEADDFLKYLIEECGLRADEVNQDGRQPLHLANYFSCKALLDLGADIEAKDYVGMTPFLSFVQRLYYLYCYDTNHAIRAIRLLYDRGCSINVVSIRKQNALHFLAASQLEVPSVDFVLDVAKQLLSFGVDIESKDDDGNLPHHLASHELKIFLRDALEQKRYAKLYELGRKKADQCKVCLIGPPGAGKTTLVKSLKISETSDVTQVQESESEEDDSADPAKRTAGIDITTANIESAGKVVFNDFAGQPDFYGTHGLFFSALTTIFLLILNLSFDDLWTPASYWLSFVKCSVDLRRRAHVILVGSRGEREDVQKLYLLAERLRKSYSEWFFIVDEVFGLDCRNASQGGMRELKICIGKVKEKCIEEGREVPSAVDVIQSDFLFRLRSSLLTATFDDLRGPLPELIANNFFPEPLSTALSEVSHQDLRDVISDSTWMSECEEASNLIAIMSLEEEISPDVRAVFLHKIDEFCSRRPLYERVTLLKMVTDEYGISATELLTMGCHVFPARLFCFLMSHVFSPVMPDDTSNLLLHFLNDIGEVILIGDIAIFDPDWLCHTVIGPVLSPKNFLAYVDRVRDGVVNLKAISTAIDNFCRIHQKSKVKIPEAVRILNQLKLCYPVPEKQDEFFIPALLEADKRAEIWKFREEMEVFVGRRIQCSGDVDIISPAGFHLLQFLAGSNHPQQSVVFWRGGMVLSKTKIINRDRLTFECLVEMQQNGRGIDIVVRGGSRSEFECKRFVDEIRQLVSKALRERSPGTATVEHFLSTTQIKELSVNPMSHSLEDVQLVKSEGPHAIVTTKSSEGLVVVDSLRDLLALPPNHVVFSGQEEVIEDRMVDMLNNDTWRAVGRSLGIRGKYLRQMSEKENLAEKFFDLWRERLDATLPNLGGALADAGRQDIISALIEDGVDLKIYPSQENKLSTTLRSGDSADGNVSRRTDDDYLSLDPQKSRQLQEAHDYAEKIRFKGSSLRGFHQSQIPAKVIHGICTHASGHAAPIQLLLDVSPSNLSMKGKVDTPYERLSQIIGVWIDKNTEPNLEELFEVIIEVGVWGAVGSYIKSTCL